MKRLLSLSLVLLIAGCSTVIQHPTPTPPPLPPPLPSAPTTRPLMLARSSIIPPVTPSARPSSQPTNMPVILSGLTNIMALEGDTITLSIDASNAPYYLWQIPGIPPFSGTNTYTITNVQTSNRGTVRVCLFTNRYFPVVSSGYISVGTTNILPDCLAVKRTATLTWCINQYTTNDQLAGFKIYYGSGQTTNWIPSVWDTNTPCGPLISQGTNWCRCYTNTISVGITNSYVFTNLPRGIPLYFAGTAVATDGTESDFSNEDQYTLPLYAKLTNAFPVTLVSLGKCVVQFYSKLCPDSVVTIQYRNEITSPWSVMATNLTTDVYGNFFYTMVADQPHRFFRLQLQ